MRLDGVIFDLDGTLIDSIPDVLNAVNRLLIEEERRAISNKQIRTLVGKGAQFMLEGAFKITGSPIPEIEVSEHVQRYLRFYEEFPANDTIIYSCVRDVLDELYSEKIKMGICSNKPSRMVEIVLAELDLLKYFVAKIGGDNFPYPKPDGRHILHVQSLMGVGNRVVYVGDSMIDKMAADDASIPVVLVNYGYGDGEMGNSDDEKVIGSFCELPKALLELSNNYHC